VVKKLSRLYVEACRAFDASGEEQGSAWLARNLLAHASGLSREALALDMEKYVGDDVCEAMEGYVQRILAGEPLAYILGTWEFYGMTLFVNEHTLIPRDDTCAVASLAIKHGLFLKQNARVLDLCTGTGCIGLAVASRLRDAKVVLADLSKEALLIAKKNVTAQKMTGRVSCVQADALKAPTKFLGMYDLIVSNPPYITAAEMEQLPKSVAAYEPHMALCGGTDGLDFYRAITENYKHALNPGGLLAYEFGMGQGNDVCAILEQNGFEVLERSEDYNGIERAVIARRK